MKNKNRYKLFLIPVLIGLFSSCEEVIEIDLNSAHPALVAEGYMERDSLCQLELNYTSDYFNAEIPEAETGALVRISDGAGNSEQLNHVGQGIYRGEALRGLEEGEYTLEIEVNDQFYQASSKLMPKPVIYKAGLEDFPFGSPHASEDLPKIMILYLGKSAGQENFFMLKIKLNGEALDEPFALASDEYNSGTDTVEYRTVVYPPPLEGDTLEVEVYAIDKDAYYYYSQVSEAISGMAMSSTPYNPPSNLGEDILGYFMARSRRDTTIYFP